MPLPLPSTIDYPTVIKQIQDAEAPVSGMALLDKLSDHWFQAYRRQVARKTNVTDMYTNGFTYLFDLEGSDHADGRGPQPPGVFPRVVAAYGLSRPPQQRGRGPDDSRMRRWMGPTESTFGNTFDKGHFIAFSIGGEVSGGETNIFPHNRALNRGRSEEGKVYRRMETFAANHPGTLFFHRPIYERETDTPDWLEVGILDSNLSLWLEVFDNRPANPQGYARGPLQIPLVHRP